jgi:hypothetical protein
MGMVLRNVLIVIASDGVSADITIPISKVCFETDDKQSNEVSLLRNLLMQISEEGDAEKIILE